MGGDFNLITSLNEKRGGIRHLDQDHLMFKDFIQNNQLIDLETSNEFSLGIIVEGVHKK
jgi:hypothetical protein